jgi:hypothetical protein
MSSGTARRVKRLAHGAQEFRFSVRLGDEQQPLLDDEIL